MELIIKTAKFLNAIIAKTFGIEIKRALTPSKIIKGGFIIIDDYGTYEGCKNAVDEFIQKLGKPIFLNEVDESVVYFIKE